MTDSPQGTVAVLTASNSQTVCSVTDFERAGYDGFTLQHAQRRDALARATIRAMCADVIIEVIDLYDCHHILEKLVSRKGYIIALIPIGYPDE